MGGSPGELDDVAAWVRDTLQPIVEDVGATLDGMIEKLPELWSDQNAAQRLRTGTSALVVRASSGRIAILVATFGALGHRSSSTRQTVRREALADADSTLPKFPDAGQGSLIPRTTPLWSAVTRTSSCNAGVA